MRLAPLGLVLCASAFATHLPVKTYTTADGLAQDLINRIVQDSRGFLWFCAGDSISRFDGHRFVTYGRDQGLAGVRSVDDLLETRGGEYVVATNRGLFRLEGSRFEEYVVNPPVTEKVAPGGTLVFEDRSGTIWFGSSTGLYRLHHGTLNAVSLGGARVFVHGLVEDSHGLWIATSSGLFRRLPQGGVERYLELNGLPGHRVESIVVDRAGRLWVATDGGVCRLVADPHPDSAIVENVFTVGDGLPGNHATVFLQASNGALWAACTGGLVEFGWMPGGQPRPAHVYTRHNGLTDPVIRALAEDHEGNLRVGTESAGAMRIQTNGFTSLDLADGVGTGRITGILEDRTGRLIVQSQASGVMVFNGSRFEPVERRLRQGGPGRRQLQWDESQFGLQTRDGEWWVPTGGDVWHYPEAYRIEDLARRSGKAVLKSSAARASSNTFRIYEDLRRDVWIAQANPAGNSLVRWDHATGKLQEYTDADGWPDLKASPPTVFREDRSGRIWIGHRSGLVLYEKGHSPPFRQLEAVPAGYVRDIYLDSAGRIWIGTIANGVIRVDDPDAERPHSVRYTIAEGLSDNQVRCITEDREGRIYVGTPKGVDRIDPSAARVAGSIWHFTTSDGLNNNYLNAAFRDHEGVLWFGTLQGLSRLVPEVGRQRTPPLIFVDAVRIRGTILPLSLLGETAIPRLTLGHSQNQMQIDFLALGSAHGEMLRYQYKLKGADNSWSFPTELRSVNYATLRPGAYHFVVRAINSAGIVSRGEASFAFTILQPVWRRWWFELLVFLTAVGILYAAWAYYVAQAHTVERMRVRIATDLHDDVGASLSQIAILSEVARRHASGADSQLRGPLLRIGGISREMIDSISEIVWAMDPRKDALVDLVRRMRQFAGEMFVARNIEFTFEAPQEQLRAPLDVESRREVYLIFKECVNNIVRHSASTHVKIRLAMEDRAVCLTVSDNGRGFDSATSSGNGLASMRARAERVGGSLEIAHRAGTMVKLTLPRRAGPMAMLLQSFRKKREGVSPHSGPRA